MRTTLLSLIVLIWSTIIAATPAAGAAKLQMREGRPIVEGVYVNGQGPYRFLVDTGANVNLIEPGLARKIGLRVSGAVEMGSAGGKTKVQESDGNEVSLDMAKASGQRFLITGMDAIRDTYPDVQGVLGTWFLSQFDYTLDFDHRQLRFGEEAFAGTRSQMESINARPVITTSLGHLALDSGRNRLLLFGVSGDADEGHSYQLRTVSGSRFVGKVSGKRLVIEGRTMGDGEAVGMPNRPEAGVDGLMPLNLFHAIYLCNSGGYVVFR